MQDAAAPDLVSVGAHEFRNRFGLVPAVLNPAVPGADE
jgi:hypothetical protein